MHGTERVKRYLKKTKQEEGKEPSPPISIVHRINYVYSGDLLTLDYPSGILWETKYHILINFVSPSIFAFQSAFQVFLDQYI